ncbi:MAG TPA: SDR family oxidoreductase [Vicinamibacterales bacterium]|nr:SDR family oxidoreductase [Vicinamibacterales bacterium]
MNLIVGATGLLGGEICYLLRARGNRVRALTRPTSDAGRVGRLRDRGVELVRGDLKDRASLDAACQGASTVITTASATLSRQAGDSIETVDRLGQLDLIDAAEAAGVGHFVLVSFPPIDIEFPLQSAKREVEARLQRSRMAYTILQPTLFDEVWLSPALGFDVANASARIYGTGHHRVSWISSHDVARFAVAALDAPRAINTVIRLGGPEALSPLDVVHLAERITGRTFTVQHVSESGLRAQYESATDPMAQTFAALMLSYAAGDVIDMAGPLRLFHVPPLRSVYEHLQSSVLQAGPTV